MTRRVQWGLGLSLVLAAGSTALALSTYTWEFSEAPANYSRSSPSHVDLYNAGGASHARLINNAYTHTQNSQPGNPLVLATPAPVQTATLTTVTTTATEGFSPTGLTDVTWLVDHLETTPPDELPVSTSGLTALYHFNEATGTTALDVRRNRNAAISGTYSWLVPGQMGQSALQLVSAAVTDGVAPQTGPSSIVNWTLEAWVKIDPAGITNANGAMVLYLGTQWFSGSGYGMWISKNEELAVSYGGVGCIIGCGSAGTVPVNAWVHLAITRDSGGFARGYINGVESTTDIDANITPIQPLGTITIGAAPGGGFGLNFPGAIDEVAVYNRVVPAAEILAHSMRKLKGTYLSNTFDASRTQTTNPPVSSTNPLVQMWRSLAWTETPADIGEEPAVSTSGLQALWRLEDLGGTVSNSVPTGPGGSLGASTVAGADDPKWLPGKLGSGGLWFDGGDFVTLSDSSVLAPSTNRTTVEAWVRPDVQGAATLYGRRTAVDVGGMALELGASGQLIFKVHSGSAWQQATTAADMVASGVWSHVAGTYDGSAVKVYVNGVESGSTAFAGTINNPASAQVRLGVNSASGGGFLRGALDAVAMYNRALPSAELQDHYTQGATSLLFKVQTSADNSTWAPLAPSSQLVAQTPGLQILWRFDEGVGRATTADTTGGTNVTADPAQLGLDQLPAGDGSDPSWEPAALAKYGNSALRFDGASDFVTTTTASPGLQSFTIELWFKAAAGVSGTLVGFGGNLLPVSALRDRLVYLDNAGKVVFGVAPGGVKKTISSTGSYLNNQWHHVAAVLGPGGMALFVDGVLQGQDATATGAQAMTGYWHLGYEDLTTWPNAPGNHRFGGTLDEVAIYDMPLDAATIARRVEESFQGLSTAAGSALNVSLVPNGRYLRVKAYLATENKAITPTLSALTASANNFPLRVGTYPQDWPYVSNYVAANPLAPDFTILGPSAFNVTLAPGSAATILYQLSRDGTNWYCYSGGLWRLVNPPPAAGACGNFYYAPLGNIQAGFESFATTVGPGKLYWRAFYLSNGDQDTRLDRITADYESASFTVTAPALNQTWLTGQPHTITWNRTGSIALVNLEYSPKGDFSDTVVLGGGPVANTGSLNWTPLLSDPVSTLNANPGQGISKIRISGADTGTGHIRDDSDAFTVTRLDLVRPNTGDTWLKGTQHTIVWNTATTGTGPGAVLTVDLQYAANGVAYTTLASGVPNVGTYDWMLPANLAESPNANPGQGISTVRISIPGTVPLLQDESEPFTVTRLTVTAPNGDTWLTSSAHTITWDTSTTATGPGAVSTVDLAYAADGASFTAVGPAPNTGTFAWTVPESPSTPNANPGFGNSRIRISVPGAAGVENLSVPFTVTRLNLTQPDSTKTWLTGKTYQVAWDTTTTPAGVPSVLLEYAADGLAFTPIATVPNAGTHDWILPTTLTVSPNSTPGQGVSTVRVSIPGAPSLVTTSQPFTVSRVDVIDPAGSVSWRLGKQHTISWAVSAPGATTLKIEYSPDNRATWLPVIASTPNTGSYLWDLPVNMSYLTNPVNSFNSYIRLTALGAGLGVLTNDSAGFTVTRPYINILEPHAGEVLGVNTVKNLAWEQEGLIGTNLKVEYSTDGGTTWTCNAPGDPGCIVFGNSGGTNPVTSPYPWVVPQAAVSATVKIRMSDLQLPEGFGMSQQFKVAGSLIVAIPVAGQVWAVGEPHTIQWTSQGTIGAVRIELSKGGPAGPFTEIDPAAPKPNGPGGGSYVWTPTAADASVNAVIRVLDAADADVKANSGVFQVTSLAITSPAGGERWLADSTHNLTWDPPVGVANIRSFYSLNNGNSWTVIGTVPAAGGSMPWTLPSQVANGTVKIRLEDADAASQEGRAQVLSNAFTIYGQLALSSPAGGESWSSGQPHPITWTTPVGTIPSVRLEYSRDNFVNEVMPISMTVNDGSESWVPTFTSTTVKVRIVDAQDPLTLSASGFFEVTGIAIQKPDGTEVWTVGSTNKAITWTFTGSFTAVRLDYSTDDFTTSTLIQDNVLNTGTYTWTTIPDAVSSNVNVRITPTSDPTLFSISSPFKIQGVLRVTSPNGNEVYDVGSPKTIRWDATGTLPLVKLQLSTNAGGVWTDIAALTNGAGGGTSPVANSYAWTVPDAISSQAQIRVLDNDPAHPASADVSDANFTIRAVLSLLSPTASDVWTVNENHPLTWTTLGTVGTVNFEYSTNAGATWVPFAAAANCASANGATPCTYNWTVLNLVPAPQSDPDTTVRLRIRDTTAAPFRPLVQVDSPDFLVKWYKITWHILDSETNNHLGGLNVSDVSSVPNWNGWTVADNSLTSTQAGTLFHYYPAGTFDTAWSRTGYFSGSASGWAADADKTVTVYLESETADQVEFHVHAESAYDPGTDTLSFKTWLEKRGLLVGTTAADLSRLGGSTIEVYDGTTLLRTLSDAAADTKGQYEFTWPATGLTGGKVYFATASVIYPNQPAPGVTRTSGGVVNVSIPKQIDTISTATGANAATLTELQTELQPITTAVATTIPDAITASQTAVEGTVTSTVGAAQGQLQSDITASQAAIQTDIATSQTAVQSTVTTAQTAIQSDVAGVQTTADAVKTDTGQIKSDVQMVLIPQAAAIKNETSLIKADTAAIQNDTTNIQADTAAMRPLTQDTNTKVSAILSDPNVGLPMVQQMLTDQGTMIQDQFKTTRRGAILNRDGSVEKGEIPAITYRSEGGVPTLDVFNALNGTRVLGPALMQFNAATGLYDFAIDTTALADGEYKVMVNEPSSATSDGTIDSFTMTVREPALRDASAGSSVTQALAELDTKVSTALNQLDGLAATADAIQSTTNTTKTVTDQLATDVQKISQGWGTQSLEQVSEQLSALSTKVGAPAQSADTSSLVSQVARLQELVQSAQGSAVSVSYSQNAMSAALEAVELLKQLHSQLVASGLPTAPPAQLEQLEAALSRLGQAVAVIPGDVAAGDMGKQVAQLAEQVKVLASEKGYAFDALYEMSESQTTDVKMVRNRVEELKALLDVQQSIMENRLNEPVVKTWFESNY